MNRVNTTQPLVITTGELDTASLIECGIQNAVSIPLGDQNLKFIEENFEWLEQFNSIIVCHDNDESGMKFVKEATARLGSWRCKVANCPEYLYNEEKKTKRHIKDINETLYWFGKEAVVDMTAWRLASTVSIRRSCGSSMARSTSSADYLDLVKRVGFTPSCAVSWTGESEPGFSLVSCRTSCLRTGST